MLRYAGSLFLLLFLSLLPIGCREPATPSVTPMHTATAVFTDTPTGAAPTATPAGTTPTPQEPQVVLNGVAFTVELAVTPAERALGLMGRVSLERDRGMLFIYEADTTPSFWMRGMLIPLDIVWIDAERVVAGVTANVPPVQEVGQPPLYFPPRPIRYVLEVNAGVAQELAIGPGSRATFVEIALAAGS